MLVIVAHKLATVEIPRICTAKSAVWSTLPWSWSCTTYLRTHLLARGSLSPAPPRVPSPFFLHDDPATMAGGA